MSPDPILHAPIVVQIHILGALTALILGPFAIWRQRRDRLHRCLGYTYAAAMAVTILSSFLIFSDTGPGPFGPIHLLSLWAAFALWRGIRHARAGRATLHRAHMRGLYIYGITIAGLLTFLPGRRINKTLFGEAESLGLWVIALGLTALLLTGLRQRRPRTG